MLARAGVKARVARKVSAGRRDGEATIADELARGDIDIVFNTPFGRGARTDGYFIRTAAVEAGVPSCTTMAGMAAAVQGIEALIEGGMCVRSLQDYLHSTRRGGEGELENA